MQDPYLIAVSVLTKPSNTQTLLADGCNAAGDPFHEKCRLFHAQNRVTDWHCPERNANVLLPTEVELPQ